MTEERISFEISGEEIIQALLEHHFAGSAPLTVYETRMSFATPVGRNVKADDFKLVVSWRATPPSSPINPEEEKTSG